MATLAQNKASQEECVCPYWSPFDSSCLLVKDDLFVPLKQHVMAHCLSGRFSWCSYYLQLADSGNQAEPAHKESVNQRRSIRSSLYNRFSYSKVVYNLFFKDDEIYTWTFDISDHGIRFASDQWLDINTVIHFYIEDEEAINTAEGIGKVVWCTPLENTYFYKVGIAFTLLIN